MRIGIKLMLVVAAALVAAAPAHAQRQSLADRVGALEQQMYNNSANQDLLNQINQLRQQVTSLQASIEQLQHDNAQLKQSAQDQYLDLDSRLNRLEGGNAAPALPPVPASAPKAAPAPANPQRRPLPSGRLPSMVMPAALPPPATSAPPTTSPSIR
jgi:TolA-binding protein